MDRARTVELAEEALAAALARSVAVDEWGYVEHPQDNFVSGISDDECQRVLDALARARGGELRRDRFGQIPFCAAHSSAALAANTFAPFAGREDELSVAGLGPFARGSLVFEKSFPTGLQGTPPTVDVYLHSDETSVAIESKCLEHLCGVDAKPFAGSYERLVRGLPSECASWVREYQALRQDERGRRYRFLGARQLVRHYLGLRQALAEGREKRITLLYLYWEPSDAEAFPIFEHHRQELQRFSQRVADPQVPFTSLAYPELWDGWQSRGPERLTRHLRAVVDRYQVAIA